MLPVFIGALRDYTQNYSISFYFAGTSSIVGSAIMLAIMFMDKAAKKRKDEIPAGEDPMSKRRLESHELDEL